MYREQKEAEIQRIKAEKERIEKEREAERLADLKRVQEFEKEKEMAQKVAQSAKRDNESRTKLAKVFGTNEKYVQDAKMLGKARIETQKKLFTS